MPAKRILLVEDECLVGELMQHVLLDAGYRVDLAATISEAWAYLRSGDYALVIVDWRLPDGDGLVVADAAAELEAKTLFMSGYLLSMAGGRAYDHPTLMKPIRPGELVTAVRAEIGESSEE